MRTIPNKVRDVTPLQISLHFCQQKVAKSLLNFLGSLSFNVTNKIDPVCFGTDQGAKVSTTLYPVNGILPISML